MWTETEVNTAAAECVRRAATNKEFRASARIIQHAINGVYERTARELLEKSAEKAASMGLSREQHIDATATQLLIMAGQAAMNVAAKRKR
jgi:hypothetical protein